MSVEMEDELDSKIIPIPITNFYDARIPPNIQLVLKKGICSSYRIRAEAFSDLLEPVGEKTTLTWRCTVEDHIETEAEAKRKYEEIVSGVEEQRYIPHFFSDGDLILVPNE